MTAFLLVVCEPAAIAETGRRLSDVDGVAEVCSDEAAAFDIGVD